MGKLLVLMTLLGLSLFCSNKANCAVIDAGDVQLPPGFTQYEPTGD